MRMPYAPGNRAWIREMCGEMTRPDWDGVEKVWKISRPHLWYLADGMADRFGVVDIFIDSRPLSRCDLRCIEAKGDECECQCNGRNHGGLVSHLTTWTEVGETTLVENGEIVRRHFRKYRDGTMITFP